MVVLVHLPIAHYIQMIALTASEEASWLWSLLSKIPIWDKPVPTTLIHCDSTTIIAKVHNHYYHDKGWQICRKHNTIKELLTTGATIMDHVRWIDENLVDHLTKGLAKDKNFKILRKNKTHVCIRMNHSWGKPHL